MKRLNSELKNFYEEICKVSDIYRVGGCFDRCYFKFLFCRIEPERALSTLLVSTRLSFSFGDSPWDGYLSRGSVDRRLCSAVFFHRSLRGLLSGLSPLPSLKPSMRKGRVFRSGIFPFWIF